MSSTRSTSRTRSKWALNATFDLFFELGATEEQIEFPVVYTSGVQGKAGMTKHLEEMKDIEPVFETIVKYIPAPKIEVTDMNGNVVVGSNVLQFLTVNLAQDNYKGKIAVGRLYSGTLKKAATVAHINRAGEIKKVS